MVLSKTISTLLRKSTAMERRTPWIRNPKPMWISEAEKTITETLSPLGYKLPEGFLIRELKTIEENARNGTGRGTFYMDELIEDVATKLLNSAETQIVCAGAA